MERGPTLSPKFEPRYHKRPWINLREYNLNSIWKMRMLNNSRFCMVDSIKFYASFKIRLIKIISWKNRRSKNSAGKFMDRRKNSIVIVHCYLKLNFSTLLTCIRLSKRSTFLISHRLWDRSSLITRKETRLLTVSQVFLATVIYR